MAITTNQQKEIKEFFEVLEKVSHFEPAEPNKKFFDLGLVIFEPNSSISAKKVYKLLPNGKALSHILDNPYSYDDFVKKLVTANREGQWLIIDCQADPAPTITTILKQVNEDSEFTISHFEDKELFRMALNPKTRIVFCINSQTLEETITYPYFLSLFGPIIRIK